VRLLTPSLPATRRGRASAGAAALAVVAAPLAVLAQAAPTARPPGTAPAASGAAAAAPEPVARLVAGRHPVVDSGGTVWGADEQIADGGTTWALQQAVTGTAHPELFRTERWGVGGYHLPVPAPGDYRVTLYETEPVFTSPGRRVFDVTAEGRSVLQRVDILSHVAEFQAWQMAFTVRVGDGVLDLGFVDRADHARVSALAVDRLPTGAAGTGAASSGAAPSTDAPTSPTPITDSPTTAAPATDASTTATPTGQAPTDPASTTAGTPPVPAHPVPASGPLRPEDFGAVGDGTADDTKALQAALDAAHGRTVSLAAGHTYTHHDVLHVRQQGTHLTGPGSLLATDESKSSVWVEADDVVLDGLTVATGATSRRWAAWEQMGIRLLGRERDVLRGVTVVRAAAAGVYVGGAGNFTLDHVIVRDSRADGIHLTAGAHDGTVVSPTIERSGDDGVAVVSYQQDGPPCHDIAVSSPTVLGTTGGRGISVVGGNDISYTNIDVRRSAAAAVYLAAEGSPWFSTAPQRVTVTGGRIEGANTDASIDHGAVLVLSGERGLVPQDVHVSGLTVADTRASASRSIGVVVYGDKPRDVSIDDMTVTGGPASAYGGNADPGSYLLRRWTVDGKAVPDHVR